MALHVRESVDEHLCREVISVRRVVVERSLDCALDKTRVDLVERPVAADELPELLLGELGKEVAVPEGQDLSATSNVIGEKEKQCKTTTN